MGWPRATVKFPHNDRSTHGVKKRNVYLKHFTRHPLIFESQASSLPKKLVKLPDTFLCQCHLFGTKYWHVQHVHSGTWTWHGMAWSSSSLFRTLVLNLARSGKQQCLPSSKIIWSNSSGTPSTGRGPVQQVHSSPWSQPTSKAYSSPHCKSEQLRSRGSSWQMLIRTPKFLKTFCVASTRKHWHSRQMHFSPALCGQSATNRIPFPTLQKTMKRSMHHIKWRAFELAGDWINILSYIVTTGKESSGSLPNVLMTVEVGRGVIKL